MANDARAKRREFLKMAATGAASVGVLSHSSFAAAVQRLMPGGKLGQPTQVAEAVVWLCSDHASWVSGLGMIIDGGYVNR